MHMMFCFPAKYVYNDVCLQINYNLQYLLLSIVSVYLSPVPSSTRTPKNTPYSFFIVAVIHVLFLSITSTTATSHPPLSTVHLLHAQSLSQNILLNQRFL